jgi:hypothetical protein
MNLCNAPVDDAVLMKMIHSEIGLSHEKTNLKQAKLSLIEQVRYRALAQLHSKCYIPIFVHENTEEYDDELMLDRHENLQFSKGRSFVLQENP